MHTVTKSKNTAKLDLLSFLQAISSDMYAVGFGGVWKSVRGCIREDKTLTRAQRQWLAGHIVGQSDIIREEGYSVVPVSLSLDDYTNIWYWYCRPQTPLL